MQKLFSPLNAPDYGTYIAQLKTDVDGVFLGFAGGERLPLLQAVQRVRPEDAGARRDDGIRRGGGAQHGRLRARLAISSCWYTAQLDNPINKRFVATYFKENGYDPGQYASGTYLYGEVLAAAIGALKGKIEDKNAFIKALRAVRVDTLRGRSRFDEYGNVVGNIYIRKVEKKDGRLVNTNIQTYPNVSQFWTYDPEGVPEAAGLLARLAADERPRSPRLAAGRRPRRS